VAAFGRDEPIGYSPTARERRDAGAGPKAADGIRSHNIALLHIRGNFLLGDVCPGYVRGCWLTEQT